MQPIVDMGHAYVMLSRCPQFNGPTNDVLFRKITKRGQYRIEGSSFWGRGGVNNDTKDFIKYLLDIDLQRRWTTDMAL